MGIAGVTLERLPELGIDEADLELLSRAGILGTEAGARLREQLEALAEAGDLARVALDGLGVMVEEFKCAEI